jgi:hypothetical protein
MAGYFLSRLSPITEPSGVGPFWRQVHRGTFTSVKDLNTKIRAYFDGWNDRAHPFTWTKTAEQILAKANGQKTSDAGH